MTTIKSIRQAGNKIRVSHFRAVSGHKELFPICEIRKNGWQNRILATSGKTILSLTTKAGQDFSAEAVCHSKENFNRRVAVSVAIGRLAKKASETGVNID
jgi:hypothetical protein